MKARVIYVKGHELSEECMRKTVDSLVKYEWDYEVVAGVTPDTLDEDEFPWKDLPDGRLESFRLNPNPDEQRKYFTKKSCLFNNLRLAREVIETNEPRVFLEHDVVVTDRCPDPKDVEDYCFLNMGGAFYPPSELGRIQQGNRLANWYENTIHKYGLNQFAWSGYDLGYHKESIYHGAMMTPGTSAYILTPRGAKKLLSAAEKHGLDQSDFIINNDVLNMEYIYPSPVKFQKVNPNLSHRL